MVKLTIILCHAGDGDSQGVWDSCTLTTDEGEAMYYDQPALIDLLNEHFGPGTVGENVIHVGVLHYEDIDDEDEDDPDNGLTDEPYHDYTRGDFSADDDE